MKKGILLLMVLFVVTLFALVGCGEKEAPVVDPEAEAPVEAVQLKLATLDVGSTWYSYGASFSELIRKELPEGSVVDVLPYSGTIGNVTLVASNEAPLGLTSAPVLKWGYAGEVAYEEKFDNLRVLVGGLDQYYYAAIARKDFPMESIKDIKDETLKVRVVTQPMGSIGEFGARLLLEAYGMTKDDITSFGGSINSTSTEVIASDMKDGRADLLLQNTSKGHPAVTDISISTDIKFIGFEEEVVTYLTEKYGFSPATLPAGSFKGQDEDVNLVGYPTVLFTNDQLSDDVAYKVTKAICENADFLKQNHGSMNSFDPAKSVELTGGIPFHPGAEKYYKEKGWL